MPSRDAAKPTASSQAGADRDYEAISRLADELLPALIAKLGASGLGEIEVRQGGWKARLRKPAGSSHAFGGSQTRAEAHQKPLPEDGDRRSREEVEAEEAAGLPIMATSPAVGIFAPRKDVAAGSKVRAGDRIGSVDVLGVREDVVAPIDGVIGTTLVEPGEAVEYGQELIRIELVENARNLDSAAADREAAAVLGEA